MISRTTEYALRGVIWLAGQPEKALTTRQIAAATQVPAGYLAKVLQQLVDGGIIRSQRGLGGGFSLARPASEITVLDVVSAVDPIPRIRSCPLNVEAHRGRLCPLHRKLDDALKTIEQAFASSTVEELSEGRQGPLCPDAAPRPATGGNLGRKRGKSD